MVRIIQAIRAARVLDGTTLINARKTKSIRKCCLCQQSIDAGQWYMREWRLQAHEECVRRVMYAIRGME